jgi:DNA-binding NarL/FixJ family response regulator
MSMNRPKVLLADDHKLVAEALKGLLEPAYEVIGIVADGRALVQAALQLVPDAVIVDIAMPLLNGLDAGKQIRKALPPTKVIILTMQGDRRLAMAAFQSGISAYVLKSAAASELLDALAESLRGGMYVSRELGASVPDLLLQHVDERPDKELTQRQIEIIQLLAEGRAMKEAADILQISVRTVADHKYRIMSQLGLKTNADLYQYAATHGIIPV